MKHSIKSKQKIDIHNMVVTVELQPENVTEQSAIKNTGSMTATDSEKELVENYLHFGLGLGEYSVLQLLDQTNNTFTLKIFV
ncbi:hypothetical protein CHU92_00415 [Flavobacterium cyanobacteriorum]|uniref:Uncharacterized protein n=1 Tax=Flavobacterium cyanobacteriorum TaxID=2022802 RepID=A0A256A7X9_9FLAO|nr:hypothetical protein [Flavobacterium cyanobacteriorum]OYQ49230.1 hypothetical protein CHU92_00415 [Flavobacterium cyanobacteriorum]